MDEKSNPPAADAPMSRVDQIESEALTLSRSERERVAETLVASLDWDPEVEKAWSDEVRRRMHDIDAGTTRLIPGDEVLKEIEDLLR
jgi:putative addiction module component (TIGR02574 family)